MTKFLKPRPYSRISLLFLITSTYLKIVTVKESNRTLIGKKKTTRKKINRNVTRKRLTGLFDGLNQGQDHFLFFFPNPIVFAFSPLQKK